MFHELKAEKRTSVRCVSFPGDCETSRLLLFLLWSRKTVLAVVGAVFSHILISGQINNELSEEKWYGSQRLTGNNSVTL